MSKITGWVANRVDLEETPQLSDQINIIKYNVWWVMLNQVKLRSNLQWLLIDYRSKWLDWWSIIFSALISQPNAQHTFSRRNRRLFSHYIFLSEVMYYTCTCMMVMDMLLLLMMTDWLSWGFTAQSTNQSLVEPVSLQTTLLLDV